VLYIYISRFSSSFVNCLAYVIGSINSRTIWIYEPSLSSISDLPERLISIVIYTNRSLTGYLYRCKSCKHYERYQ